MRSRPDNGPGSGVTEAALETAPTVLALARDVALTAAALAGNAAQRSAP